MRYKFGKTVVVAFGGSLIFPQDLDWRFLRRFRLFIKNYIGRTGKRLIIVSGGGKLARIYQDALFRMGISNYEKRDFVGIQATKCNAHLLKVMFEDVADPLIFDARHTKRSLRYPITIASGWKPGWSTDYVAVVLAHDFGVGEVVIAGQPKYVYDRDPNRYQSAHHFRDISWQEYRRLIPRKWMPGIHAPVDPVAASFAQSKGIRALVVGGGNIKNLNNLLSGRNFRGTIIY